MKESQKLPHRSSEVDLSCVKGGGVETDFSMQRQRGQNSKDVHNIIRQ